MKYYQNKQTKQIIGITDMLELISYPTEISVKLGFKGYSHETIYCAIFPNKILGNGIKSFTISYSFLKEKYKRINKKIALKKYPIFTQYRHADMVIEAAKRKMKGIDVLMKQTL